MRREPLAAIVTSDLSAQCRGRSVRQSELDKYLVQGCGWVPANLALNPFGDIIQPNPFGTVGDLRLRPDPATTARIPATDDEQITTVLADIVNLDGSPWDCCPRTFLRQAIADLKAETGLDVVASFEHEFTLLQTEPDGPNVAFSLKNLVEHEPLGAVVMAALDDAGLRPETWLPEYGARQWEVTVAPSDALTAADRAVLLREIVRTCAFRLGHQASFSPVADQNSGGNGVHIHLSLVDGDGEPATHDPARDGGLSEVAGSFTAGILRHAAALTALAASSVVSYERLVPGHWSVGGAFIGANREALLRICEPFDTPQGNPRRQYNVEYRAADATSNPWIVLGALIRAGLAGIRDQLATPPVVAGDAGELSGQQRAAHHITPLPGSLDEAIAHFESDTIVKGWFADRFVETFLLLKNAEIEYVKSLSDHERYTAYSSVY